MSHEEQKPIGKNTLRLLSAIGRVDDAISNFTFPVWKRLLARKGVEVYRIRTPGEMYAMRKKAAELMKDAAKFAFEGDLSEGLFSERDNLEAVRIRITKTPDGDAPDSVRKNWKGIEIDAYELPGWSGEVDIKTGEPIPERKGNIYVVNAEEALKVLGERSPEAAEWFRQNIRPDLSSLSFGEKEIKVIPNRKK